MDGMGERKQSFMSILYTDDLREGTFSTSNIFISLGLSTMQGIKHCFKKIRNDIESRRQTNRNTKVLLR